MTDVQDIIYVKTGAIKFIVKFYKYFLCDFTKKPPVSGKIPEAMGREWHEVTKQELAGLPQKEQQRCLAPHRRRGPQF